MKKLLSMLAVVMVLSSIISCEKHDEVVSAASLPYEVTAFVQTHFPNVEILNVIKDYSGQKAYDFEITLNDGTRLDISKNGKWKEVENYKKGVPSSIMPMSIVAYVTDNHPDAIVVSIDRERGYEVALSVGLDVVFDQSGNFSRYDN